MSPKPQPPEFDSKTNEPIRNWTKISNRLTEELFPKKVSGPLQLALILHIARETWGAGKEWMQLSRSKACEHWGVSRQAFATAIEDARERGLIETKRQGENSTATWFRMTQWTDVKDYTPPKPTPIPVLPSSLRGVQLTLFPGKHSRFTIRIGDTDQQYEYWNELSQPAMLDANVAADGTVFLSIRTPASKESEQRPSALGRRKSEDSSQTAENTAEKPKAPNSPKRDRQKPFRFTAPPPEDPRTAAYRAFLTPLFLERWAKDLDDDLLFNVVKASKEAPVEAFERIVTDRLRRDSLRKLNPGILTALAADAARAHQKSADVEAEEAERQREQFAAVQPVRPVEPLDPAKRWDRIRAVLQHRPASGTHLAEESYRNWFERSRQIEETESSTTVALTDRMTKQIVTEEFGRLLVDVCHELGEPLVIRFVTEEEISAERVA